MNKRECNILVINEAKYLLEKKTWIQGNYATDKDGNFIAPDSPNAECFCTLGALRHVVWVILADKIEGWNPHLAYERSMYFLRNFTPNRMTIAKWNDMAGRKKEDVIDLLKEALSDLAL